MLNTKIIFIALIFLFVSMALCAISPGPLKRVNFIIGNTSTYGKVALTDTKITSKGNVSGNKITQVNQEKFADYKKTQDIKKENNTEIAKRKRETIEVISWDQWYNNIGNALLQDIKKGRDEKNIIINEDVSFDVSFLVYRDGRIEKIRIVPKINNKPVNIYKDTNIEPLKLEYLRNIINFLNDIVESYAYSDVVKFPQNTSYNKHEYFIYIKSGEKDKYEQGINFNTIEKVHTYQ